MNAGEREKKLERIFAHGDSLWFNALNY